MKSKSLKNKIPVPSSEKSFTTTEVGAMIESFDEKLTLIAEDVSGLHQKFDLMAEGSADKIIFQPQGNMSSLKEEIKPGETLLIKVRTNWLLPLLIILLILLI